MRVCNADPTNVISQYDYAYDAVRCRVSCTKSGIAYKARDTNFYSYNARSELTNAVSAVDSSCRFRYKFDDMGSRILAEERSVCSSYLSNQLNQYSVIDGFTPRYYDDGNQTLVKTREGVWNVLYNAENRPILWSNESAVVKMRYDHEGRRVFKESQTKRGADSYCFIYDHENLIAVGLGTNSLAYVLRAPLAVGYEVPLAYISPSCESLFYMSDANRNIVGVVNAEDAILNVANANLIVERVA